MRRGTLITIIALFVLLVVAAIFQVTAARGPRRYPGPGQTSVPSPSVSISPSPAGP